MSDTKRIDGLTRRDFIKTIGLGGAAVSALGVSVPAAEAQGQQSGEKTASVPRRTLGKTGIEVSSLCLGGMFDTLNNQLMLKQALKWGVTYWDTAEAYGNGMSEEGYGRFFSRNPEARKEVVVATKFHPSNSVKELSEATDNALKRLHTDYVDIFLLHGISSMSEFGAPAKEWASQMKQAGKIKAVGFSAHSNMEELLLASAKLDWIDVILFSYNFRLMHEQKMKEAVEACAKAGIGLVAMKTQGGGPVKSDSEAELKLAGRFLERGFTDKQAKLKAVWENPQIASICSQMPTLTILSANVAAARDATSLSKSDMELMRRLAQETRSSYCAGCGRICSEAVSGAVPVSDVMRCLMYYRDYGDRELARSVFASFPDPVRERLAAIDYSEADRVCPQGLNISALMREASEIFC